MGRNFTGKIYLICSEHTSTIDFCSNIGSNDSWFFIISMLFFTTCNLTTIQSNICSAIGFYLSKSFIGLNNRRIAIHDKAICCFCLKYKTTHHTCSHNGQQYFSCQRFVLIFFTHKYSPYLFMSLKRTIRCYYVTTLL